MAVNLTDEVARLFNESERAASLGNWEQVASTCRQLLPMLESISDHVGCGRIQLRIGRANEELGQTADARLAYERALEIAQAENDVELQAAALHRQGHVLRMSDATAAKNAFQNSRDLEPAGTEGRALCLAMIGQIDFTEGNEFEGLETMLQALLEMPEDAATREHLIEHIVYFGSKIPRHDYLRLVRRKISDEECQQRLETVIG